MQVLGQAHFQLQTSEQSQNFQRMKESKIQLVGAKTAVSLFFVPSFNSVRHTDLFRHADLLSDATAKSIFSVQLCVSECSSPVVKGPGA